MTKDPHCTHGKAPWEQCEDCGDGYIREQPTSKDVVVLAALEAAKRAMDDWVHSYAPEFCKAEYVEQTHNRLVERGTLAYIAAVTQQIRDAMALMQADEGKV